MTATLPSLDQITRQLLADLRAHRESPSCRARDRAVLNAVSEVVGTVVPWALGGGLVWVATALAAAWNSGL